MKGFTENSMNVEKKNWEKRFNLIKKTFEANNKELYLYDLSIYNDKSFCDWAQQLVNISSLKFFNEASAFWQQKSKFTELQREIYKTLMSNSADIILGPYHTDIKQDIILLTKFQKDFCPDFPNKCKVEDFLQYDVHGVVKSLCIDEEQAQICDYMQLKSAATSAFYKIDANDSITKEMMQYIYMSLLKNKTPASESIITIILQTVIFKFIKKVEDKDFNLAMGQQENLLKTYIFNETETLKEGLKLLGFNNKGYLDPSKDVLNSFVKSTSEYCKKILQYIRSQTRENINNLKDKTYIIAKIEEYVNQLDGDDYIKLLEYIQDYYFDIYLKGGSAFRMLFAEQQKIDRVNNITRLDAIDLNKTLGDKSDYDLNAVINPYLSEKEFITIQDKISLALENLFKYILNLTSAGSNIPFVIGNPLMEEFKKVLASETDYKNKFAIDIDTTNYTLNNMVVDKESKTRNDTDSFDNQNFLFYSKNDIIFTDLPVSTEFILHRLMLNFTTKSIKKLVDDINGEPKYENIFCDLETKVELIDISIVKYGGRERFKKWNNDKKNLVKFEDLPPIKGYNWKEAIKDLQETIEDNEIMRRLTKLEKRKKRKNFLTDMYCLYVKEDLSKENNDCTSLLEFVTYKDKYYFQEKYAQEFIKEFLPHIKNEINFKELDRINLYLESILKLYDINYYETSKIKQLYVQAASRKTNDKVYQGIMIYFLNLFYILLQIHYGNDYYIIYENNVRIISLIVLEVTKDIESIETTNSYENLNEDFFEELVMRYNALVIDYREFIIDKYNVPELKTLINDTQRFFINYFCEHVKPLDETLSIVLVDDTLMSLNEKLFAYASRSTSGVNFLKFNLNVSEKEFDNINNTFIEWVPNNGLTLIGNTQGIYFNYNAKTNSFLCYIKRDDTSIKYILKTNQSAIPELDVTSDAPYYFCSEIKLTKTDITDTKLIIPIKTFITSIINFTVENKENALQEFETDWSKITTHLPMEKVYATHNANMINSLIDSIYNEKNLNILNDKLKLYFINQKLYGSKKDTNSDELLAIIEQQRQENIALRTEGEALIRNTQSIQGATVSQYQNTISNLTEYIQNSDQYIQNYRTNLAEYIQNTLQYENNCIMMQQNLTRLLELI
jgi:hypothetical protein